eukprot:31105-Pelagococcus_subviridis.AAC.3
MSNASTSLTISTNAAPDAYSASGGASPLRRSSFASLFRRLRVSGSTLAAAAAGLFFLPPPPLLCFIPDSGPSLSNRIRRRSFTLASYAAPTSASARALDATASIRSGSSRSVATAFTQGGAVASGTQSQNGAYGFGVEGPYEATSGWSSKASAGVERRRGVSGIETVGTRLHVQHGRAVHEIRAAERERLGVHVHGDHPRDGEADGQRAVRRARRERADGLAVQPRNAHLRLYVVPVTAAVPVRSTRLLLRIPHHPRVVVAAVAASLLRRLLLLLLLPLTAAVAARDVRVRVEHVNHPHVRVLLQAREEVSRQVRFQRDDASRGRHERAALPRRPVPSREARVHRRDRRAEPAARVEDVAPQCRLAQRLLRADASLALRGAELHLAPQQFRRVARELLGAGDDDAAAAAGPRAAPQRDRDEGAEPDAARGGGERGPRLVAHRVSSRSDARRRRVRGFPNDVSKLKSILFLLPKRVLIARRRRRRRPLLLPLRPRPVRLLQLPLARQHVLLGRAPRDARDVDAVPVPYRVREVVPLGSFHNTKRSRGGVERRQVEMKGGEVGD